MYCKRHTKRQERHADSGSRKPQRPTLLLPPIPQIARQSFPGLSRNSHLRHFILSALLTALPIPNALRPAAMKAAEHLLFPTGRKELKMAGGANWSVVVTTFGIWVDRVLVSGLSEEAAKASLADMRLDTTIIETLGQEQELRALPLDPTDLGF